MEPTTNKTYIGPQQPTVASQEKTSPTASTPLLRSVELNDASTINPRQTIETGDQQGSDEVNTSLSRINPENLETDLEIQRPLLGGYDLESSTVVDVNNASDEAQLRSRKERICNDLSALCVILIIGNMAAGICWAVAACLIYTTYYSLSNV